MFRALLVVIGVAGSSTVAARVFQPQDAMAVSLGLNSSMTLQIVGPGKDFRVSSLQVEPAAATSRFEADAVASLPTPGGEQIGPVRDGAAPANALPAVPFVRSDQIRLALKLSPDRTRTLLLIQNGYGRPIHFRVGIVTRDGKPAPREQATICPVPAHGRTLENWTFPIARLVIYGPTFISDDRTTWRCD